jgi:hypothetical protein
MVLYYRGENMKGFNWLAQVLRGVKFVEGVREDQQLAAA